MGTYVRFWAVLGHKGHSEVGTEEGPGEPASSFPCCQFLSHHDGSLEDTLTCGAGETTHAAAVKGEGKLSKKLDDHRPEVSACHMIGKKLQA